LADVSGLDGKNQWENIMKKDADVNDIDHDQTNDYQTRNEILLNMDERIGLMALRHKHWKYINGLVLIDNQ
jgi:arylsulfatase A-like enzyme